MYPMLFAWFDLGLGILGLIVMCLLIGSLVARTRSKPIKDDPNVFADVQMLLYVEPTVIVPSAPNTSHTPYLQRKSNS
jgi:hypothetical protein